MVRKFRRILGVVLSLSVAVLLVITGSAGQAKADGGSSKGDPAVCYADGSWVTSTIEHKAVTAEKEVVVPGKAAVTDEEQRWMRQVVETTTETVLLRQFSFTEPEVLEEYLELVQYLQVIPGLKEISHLVHQFSRENPGSKEVSHPEYQFERTNPGQKETFTTQSKFKKVIPGQDGVKECEWKKSVDDFKTKYQYQKKVKGVVEKKVGKTWKQVDTFGWEWYTNPSYKWSFENKEVLESGPHSSTQSTWTEGGYQYRKVTTHYQYAPNGVTEQVKTGSHWEYQWSVDSPGSGWIKTDNCRWKVQPVPEQVVWYNNGDWTTDTLGDPWIKVDERQVGNGDAVAPFAEYKTNSGVTTVKAEASWFTDSSFEGWSQFNSRQVVDQEAVAPFTEWRAQDGSTTTNVADAGWFTDPSFEGWSQYGEAKKVVTQEATPDRTIYLTYDGTTFGQTEDSSEASWIYTTVTVGPEWSKVTGDDGQPLIQKEITQEYVPERTYYLVSINEDGTFVTSEDSADAGWFLEESVESWDQYGETKEETRQASSSYVEFYVSGGEPTQELGESNWTTDEPGGDWKFVDRRTVTVTPAIPDTTKKVTVIVKGPWTQTVREWKQGDQVPCPTKSTPKPTTKPTPGKTKPGLPSTGGPGSSADYTGVAGIALMGILIVGLTAAEVGRHKKQSR